MTSDSTNSLAQRVPDFQFAQAFAEKAEIIFWIADPGSYQLLYVSAHAEKALGFPIDVWLQPLFWQTHLFEGDRERVVAALNEAAISDTAQHIEYRMIGRNGNLVWLRDRICMVVSEGISYLCGMMTDVTAFKTAVDHHTGTRGYTSIFLEIVTLLSSNEEIKEKLEQLAEKLCYVFGLTAVSILSWEISGYFALHDAPNEEAFASFGAVGNRLNALIYGLGWWQTTPGPVLSHHGRPALSDWEKAHLQLYDAKTILYVPILGEDEVIGCLELIDRNASRTFARGDIELSRFVAQQAALAIARAQLFKTETSRRREAEILLDVAEFVSSSLDRDEILTRVMEILRVYLNDVHNCSISLITDDGLQLETIFSWHADEVYALFPKGGRLAISESFASQLALESGEPILISDLKQVPFTNKFTADMKKSGLRAILCVPLKIKNKPMGTLHVHHWHQPKYFSTDEIALLEGVANQAAIAIENARLFANERRQLNLSRTLQKVGALLTTSLQPEEVYEQIFNLLGQVVSYNSASLFRLDKVNEQFVLVRSRGFDKSIIDPQDFVLPADLVYEQIAISPGWSVVLNVRSMSSWVELAENFAARAWIGAFLVVKGEINGILSVDGANVGQYSDEDGRMVAAFANQAAIAIENARLYDETMRQAKELAILNQVSQETAVSLNIDSFLERVTRTVGAELFPHSFGFVMYDAETKELRPHASYTPVAEKLEEKGIPLDYSIVGQVVLSGRQYYAPNVLEDPHFFATVENVLSEIAVPLKLNQEVVGVIDVASPKPDAFSPRDINFLTTLAGNIAAVMERARLYETLRVQAAGLAEEVAQRTGELKLERDRLFAILESAGEGILLTDTESNILYANPAMEWQTGYSREELQSKHTRILGSDQTPRVVYTEMWQSLQAQKSWTGELINQHKEGHTYDVTVTIMPIVDDEGEVTGFVSVHSDITRLKELERLKTEFIANVSHQLRTPLTNIKTYVSLLKKGKPEKFPRYFSVLHDEIDRLARLIQDLLDISRLDAERAPKPDAAVDLLDFWEIFWPQFEERAERENRRLHISFPEDVSANLPILFIESYQLEKILSRLVDNSLTYTSDGGLIQISVLGQDESSNMFKIQVCDDGPGIPEAERPFIFDRFFRGAQAIESGLSGNGLGLAIVKELLLLYGGEITLENEPNEGCCFTLHLPLARPNEKEDTTENDA